MSMAFEITQDDVEIVLGSNQAFIRDAKANISDLAACVFDGLDVNEIESAALDADIDEDDSVTLDNQTNAAFAMIRQKMVEMGVLTQ